MNERKTAAFLVTGGRADLYASPVDENAGHGRLHHLATLTDGQSFLEISPVDIGGVMWECVVKCAVNARIVKTDAPSVAQDLQRRFEALVMTREDHEIYESLAYNIKKLGAKEMMENAVDSLAHLNEKLDGVSDEDLQAETESVRLCSVLCKYLKSPLKIPVGNIVRDDENMVTEILYLSGVRYRTARLEEDWWKNECGPLLGKLDGAPVVLLPHAFSGYTIYNARSDKTTRVTAETATRINPEVKEVFRALPPRKLGIKDVAAFILGEHLYKDAVKILIFSVLATFVQILPPILSAQIFDTVIPGAMRGLLLQLILILSAFEISNIGLSVLTNLGLSRIDTKLDISLQAAVWDRLLNLKINFFHKFSTGELLVRIKGMEKIRQTLSPDFMKRLLIGLFSFANIYVLFRYNEKVAPYALLIFLFAFVVSAIVWRRKQKLSTEYTALSGEASGIYNQIITGIERVKASAAEERVFYVWSKYETELRYLEGRIKLLDHFSSAFYTFYEFASAAVIYLLVFLQGTNGMGSFVAFISSFLIFQKAIMSVLKSIGKIPEIIPLADNMSPIFETEPENNEHKTIPKEMSGGIEFNHVSFRYSKYTEDVLKDISFKLEPGQSLGVIGASGSGKSTILRLLLGFHKLTEGKIYIGGHDWETIDLRYLRKNMSVVSQDVHIVAGSIYDNITDNDYTVTEKDVNEAIRAACLSEDIKNLPEGLHTLLEPRSRVLSAGQKQKVLIARAIVKKRRYFLLDEATSSLDSVTQSDIMRILSEIPATKIIVAQRLPTVRHCDKIIVIDKGRIVGEGTYDEIVRKTNNT